MWKLEQICDFSLFFKSNRTSKRKDLFLLSTLCKDGPFLDEDLENKSHAGNKNKAVQYYLYEKYIHTNIHKA